MSLEYSDLRCLCGKNYIIQLDFTLPGMRYTPDRASIAVLPPHDSEDNVRGLIRIVRVPFHLIRDPSHYDWHGFAWVCMIGMGLVCVK